MNESKRASRMISLAMRLTDHAFERPVRLLEVLHILKSRTNASYLPQLAEDDVSGGEMVVEVL